MHTSPLPALADPAAAVRDAVLSQARDTLRDFGSAHGFLAGHLCGCGRSTCLNDRVETMSVVSMLRAVTTGWTAGPDPAGEVLLRERLLAFARTFALDACPAGDPDCECNRIAAGDARAVLRSVADLWHGRAGNRVQMTPDDIGAMADTFAHNLRVLDALAHWLDPVRAKSFRPVLAAARAAEGGVWLTEARAMAAEAIASWLPAPSTLPHAARVLDAALSVTFRWEWATEDATDFERAAADACSAVLVRGLVHDSITSVLFGPIGGVIHLSDLDTLAEAIALADAA